jgi:hypothetical protein
MSKIQKNEELLPGGLTGSSPYLAVKKLVNGLAPDTNIILLVTVLDAAPRAIRSEAVLRDAEVLNTEGKGFGVSEIKTHLETLRGTGLLFEEKGQLIVSPRYWLYVAMNSAANAPAEASRLGDVLFRLCGYSLLSKDTEGRQKSNWNFVFDYTSFAHRTLLLMLSHKVESYRLEIRSLARHNEWRLPEKKRTTQEEAQRPFLHFDYDFYRNLDPYFTLRCFHVVMNGDATYTDETSKQLSAFLRDADFDQRHETTFDVAAMGFGESLSVGKRDDWTDITKIVHRPRVAYLTALIGGKEEVADQLTDEFEVPGLGSLGLADIVKNIREVAKGRTNAPKLGQELHLFKECPVPGALEAYKGFVHLRMHNVDMGEQQLEAALSSVTEENPIPVQKQPISFMVGLWVYAWSGLKPNPRHIDELVRFFPPHVRDEDWHESDHPLAEQPYLLGELMHTLSHTIPGDPRAKYWREESLRLSAKHGFTYLLRLLPVPAPWEYTLRILEQVAQADAPVEQIQAEDTRLMWIVDFDKTEIIVREQKKGSRGWSKGRQIKAQELVENTGQGRFSTADERAITSLTRKDGRQVTLGGRYSQEGIVMDFGRTLYYLDGHPQLVLDNEKRIPLEVVRAKPEMVVGEDDDDLKLQFIPPGAAQEGFHWEKQTPTRYRIYAISAEQARLARAIGAETKIPIEKRERVDQFVTGLREQVRVTSTADLEAEDLPDLLGDSRPCAQLLPYGAAYKLELYARPIAGTETYFRVGEGMEKVVVVKDTPEGPERILVTRDLKAEVIAADEMVADCPTLKELGNVNYEWTLDDDYVALRVLLELRSLQQESRISVEHPKGEKIKLIASVGVGDLKIQLRKKRDWFEVSGKLVADEDAVVSFQKLLEHVRNGGGDFVELSEGEFVAITSELRARLEAMEGFLHKRKDGVELPPLAAMAFAELTEDLEDVEADEAWHENIARIAKTEQFDPTVPTALLAELRDYQVDGYRWLRRLAEWGVGGCLADDMGLGKTVQALALLIARQSRGPALVIAPASVTRNWEAETKRFAPSLTPKLLSTSSDTHVLESLEAGDICLVSYGLLTFVEEQLLASTFSTIVLDEAQAIKNPATKRAKLIFQLDAEMRIATTGTPIENHLGELWSLFRFINPGLLGSRRAFNEKYAGPIRRENNEQQSESLRNLVRPFILRRRKEEVLKELPPKTEVNLAVELSEPERAMYEAIRREAVDEIENANAQAQRFMVLKQLTRLRQASCHPKLVKESSTLSSAKLELVASTVLELIETGHQALIFSQFVKHLKLVEDWVKTAGLKYCYLDGSTPGGKRQKQVEAFQAGEADLFLISLKAGGTGLNLTAADYVLHLDPWWNPAAEDQASDRAHRIGQERPVTVYRFVSTGTIEESILALHAEKRDLADQILSGTDVGGSLSVTEVVDLLKSGE